MQPRTRAQTLLKLFLTNLYISSFTFGGGFVIVTFMKRKYVDDLKWLTENEMLDMTALAQSAPGAIAVNASILVGWRVAGFLGMLVSVLGTIIPPIVVISIISFIYSAFITNPYVAVALKGMQAGVAAVILDVVFTLGGNVVKKRQPLLLVVMALAFIATFFFKVNVIYIILAGALAGLVMEWTRRKQAAE